MSSPWLQFASLEPSGGCLLVATPALSDPHFTQTVVYLLEHDEAGSVGVILNRPSHTPVGQVLPEWHEAVSGPAVVFGGGPVQPDGALCLAHLDADGPGVRRVVGVVGTVDLDGDLALLNGVARRMRVFAGHSGWSEGQLADEIADGAWWVVAGSPEDLFSDEPREMWRGVLRRQPYPLCLMGSYTSDPISN